MKPAAEESVALYRKIEAELRHKVDLAIWPSGAMLPSRRDLAREYNVSTLTIERAIECLVRDGLLRSDDRRGTFVASRAAVTAPEPVRLQATHQTIGIVGTLYPIRHDHLELNNYWSRLLTQAIEGAFADQGQATRFTNRIHEDCSIRSLSSAVKEALDAGVDGLALLAFGHSPEEVDDSVAQAIDRGIPAVCVTAGALTRPVPHVFLDGQDAGYQAAQHLVKHGCNEILFLSPFHSWWTDDRLTGARNALIHANQSPEALHVFPEIPAPWINELDPEALGYESACKAFEQGVVPKGVICANDGVALGFLRAAAQYGHEPGKDVLVIGFDDRSESRIRHLSSLRPSMEAMGTEAARLLRHVLSNRQESLQVRLRWRLIARASSRLPSA